jgi:hypothetical protein
VQPFESVAVIVTPTLSAVVGVPLIVPDDERLNPPGSEPAVTANVYGDVPPLALTGWLYEFPTVSSGSETGDNEIAGQVTVNEINVVSVRAWLSEI